MKIVGHTRALLNTNSQLTPQNKYKWLSDFNMNYQRSALVQECTSLNHGYHALNKSSLFILPFTYLSQVSL